MSWRLRSSVAMAYRLGAAAPVDHHSRQHTVYDVVVVVEVEHRDGRHLSWRAARSCRTGRVGLLDQMRVRILLKEHVWTLAAAVVGFVALGRDDPIPAELLEVHSQRVATAADFLAVLFAVESDHSSLSVGRLGFYSDFDERYLALRTTIVISRHGMRCSHKL